MITSKQAETELQTLLRARYPLIWICTTDERRVERAIQRVAQSLDIGLQLWSCATGWSGPNGSRGENVLEPDAALGTVAQWSSRCVFMMRDFHPYVDPQLPTNVAIIRAIRDVGSSLKAAPKDAARAIIFTSPSVDLPAQLAAEVVLINWPLPDAGELEAALDSVAKVRNLDLNGSREKILAAASGLTLIEAENAFARSLISTGTIDAASVASSKRQAVAKSGILEWIDPDPSLKVAGLGQLQQWLTLRRGGFSKAAAEYGIPEPKGILCVGVPGGGKSLSAKVTAAKWDLPLLRLDVGRCFGALVGQSEEQIREALKTAEASAPCILWLN